MAEVGELKTDKLDPEREARRRLALAQIRQYPDPALRMRANEVESFDEDLAALVERLISLMQDSNGVGLAATQIGILRRVFVFQPNGARPDDEEEAEAESEPPRALVNPRIVATSDEKEGDDEGCLSLQGVQVPVERHLTVTVEATDPEGNEVTLELEGHPARIVQHEVDHLDGVLMLDRTTPESRREALGLLRPQASVPRGY
ncbi:MAG: peptide deformylase [Actinomycetota bacterium]|nr:peptide deformylase [Actinomycetota bacterium]